jgi:hypothetical protein
MREQTKDRWSRWRREITQAPRGSQKWDTREAFYFQILVTLDPDMLPHRVTRIEPMQTPRIAEICDAKSGLARSTFYATFGARSSSPSCPGMPGDLNDVEALVWETKAWSFEPYLAGLKWELDLLSAHPLHRVESTLSLTARWAMDTPGLASALRHTPPINAVDAVARSLPSGTDSDSSDVATKLLTHVIQNTCDHLDWGSIVVARSISRTEASAFRSTPSRSGADRASGLSAADDLEDHICSLADEMLDPINEHRPDVPEFLAEFYRLVARLGGAS